MTYALKFLLLKKIAKNKFLAKRHLKLVFRYFIEKVSVLDNMLLHNSYINVAIAVIKVYNKSLYNAQELR